MEIWQFDGCQVRWNSGQLSTPRPIQVIEFVGYLFKLNPSSSSYALLDLDSYFLVKTWYVFQKIWTHAELLIYKVQLHLWLLQLLLKSFFGY